MTKKRARIWRIWIALLVLVLILAAIILLRGDKMTGWVMEQLYPRRFSGTVSREAGEFTRASRAAA